jgi:hypothetical protein
MEIIIYAGLHSSSFNSLSCFTFACLEPTSIVLIFLKFPQSVILLGVSSDSRLSWSIGRLSMEIRHSIEIATNTHEYL